MLNCAYPRNGAFANPLSHASSRPFGLPELTDEEIVARGQGPSPGGELSAKHPIARRVRQAP